MNVATEKSPAKTEFKRSISALPQSSNCRSINDMEPQGATACHKPPRPDYFNSLLGCNGSRGIAMDRQLLAHVRPPARRPRNPLSGYNRALATVEGQDLLWPISDLPIQGGIVRYRGSTGSTLPATVNAAFDPLQTSTD